MIVIDEYGIVCDNTNFVWCHTDYYVITQIHEFFFSAFKNQFDERKWVKTYALTVMSNNIAAIGTKINPNQNTGDENINLSMPENTAAIGIDGQKLLK